MPANFRLTLAQLNPTLGAIKVDDTISGELISDETIEYENNGLDHLMVTPAGKAMPELPTIAESGYPGFSATNWYAFIATSKMSPALQERWNAELVKVLKSPDVVEALNSHGLTPLPGTRDELAKYMEKETATWGRIIRERKITME